MSPIRPAMRRQETRRSPLYGPGHATCISTTASTAWSTSRPKRRVRRGADSALDRLTGSTSCAGATRDEGVVTADRRLRLRPAGESDDGDGHFARREPSGPVGQSGVPGGPRSAERQARLGTADRDQGWNGPAVASLRGRESRGLGREKILDLSPILTSRERRG